MAVAEEAAAAASTMDAAFEEQLKEGAEAFEFQAEVKRCCLDISGLLYGDSSSVLFVLLLYCCCIGYCVGARGVSYCRRIPVFC